MLSILIPMSAVFLITLLLFFEFEFSSIEGVFFWRGGLFQPATIASLADINVKAWELFSN